MVLASSCKSTPDRPLTGPPAGGWYSDPPLSGTHDPATRTTTPEEKVISSASDPANIAETAMGPEQAPMARPMNWARLSRAKVTRLDWSGKVAMLDVGKSDGVLHGDKYYTFRGERLTGLLIPVKVFGQMSICVAGNAPPGKNTAKMHKGDRVVPRLSIVYPKSVYPESVMKQLEAVKQPIPAEDQLKSLQESIDAARRGAHIDQMTQLEESAKTVEARRKQIEDAWKETVAKVKSYKPLVNP